MTVDEVTAVHVEEEEVTSSSSKVEIAVEEDQVKKDGKEDLSNGVNGKTVREDTDGDGDYVFVNGNDGENGDPVDSDLERNNNGIGGGDQGVESVETEGEVKSKTDLVKDFREEGESCIEIVDQDEESLELCHEEAPVDEHKSGDLVQSGPVSATNAENGVSETAMADQNEVSESAEDVSDAKNIVEHTVSEAAAVDSSDKQSDEISSVSVSDVNVLDFRSKGNEESEMAVADASDCNGDCLDNDSAKATVSEANDIDSRSKENEGSEMAVASDGDCNGGGLANDGAKNNVSEATVLDFRSKENEGSEMALTDDGNCNDNAKATDSEADVIESGSKENGDSGMVVADDGDCNGNALADDSAEANVIDSRLIETEGFEMVVADDDNDCNGDGLANVSAKATVSEANVLNSGSNENEGSEMAVADDGDCNGDGLANDIANAIVSEANVINSKSKEDEGSQMAVADDDSCNGDGLANSSAATVSESNILDSRSKGNESSEMVVADDCNGDGLGYDSATVSEAAVDTRNGQTGGFDLPVTGDGVTTISVSDRGGDCLPDVREKDTVSKVVLVDSRVEQNESSNSISNKHEQNGISEIPEMVLQDVSGNESVKVGESLTAADEFPVENGLGSEHDTEGDLASVVDTNLEKEAVSGSFSDECGEALQDGISETVQINDSVDSGHSSELVESSLSPITNKNVHVTVEGVLTDTIADVVEDTSSTVTLHNDARVESGVSDTTTETLPSPADDEKLETEVIESDENSGVSFENSEIDIKDEDGSIGENLKSRCLDNGDGSILSEEAEVSKVFVECHSAETGEKLVDVVDVLNDSNPVALVSNDEKTPAATEKLSAADISYNDEPVRESREPNIDANINEETRAVIKGGIQFGTVTCQQSEEPEGLDEVERKSPFYFLIRVPRYDDENLKEKIRLAQVRVDEKTQSRDAIRSEIQKMRAICKKYGDNFDAAISQERAIRDLHRSKRQEIDSIQSMMNIEDIDAKIRNMEHMIQHETMPLKDEKQYIHQIKQYKQTRERISSNMGRQDEVQQGSDQIKERMKSLKKEADQLKVNLLKAEAATKAAKKEYHDEAEKLNKLQSQFKAADDIRQEAYSQLLSLKKQSYEKNKLFWQYRDDAKVANDLALKGDKEALQNLCVNQVEKVMDLWNNNDEFRKEYIRCNVRSTLRRLRTFDGRALGPDEEPPVIPQVVNERVAKDHTVSNSTFEEQTREKKTPAKAETAPAKAEAAKDKLAAKPVEQKIQTSKPEKSTKPVPPPSGSTTASIRDTTEEEEKPKITKEEEERLRKAEELRKEEEAAKLREQHRLEEIAKAKEALERKRRNAEKAQARAALRAQKEAEQKEKEREKKAKKKERRKGAAAASVTDETESLPTLETQAETPQESQTKEKPVTVAKRSQKPSQFTKQTKAKSIPPPLRNRGKRKMQPWMWVLLTCVVIFALFLVGNHNFSFNFRLLQKF
ncbi:hypothetical protein GQ457_01G006030 [Hibiscus cannabinus]